MHSRRALLYMPGDDRHKIEKALTLDVDCICMDMEDGVAFNRKEVARRTIALALQELDFGRSERLARINPIGSGFEEPDLAAVLPAHPDGIVVPKVENTDQLAWVADRLETAELTHGWPVNSIRLIAILENARAIMLNLAQIAAHPRLDALIFGAEDFAADIGAIRTPDAWEIFYARSAVVAAAAAFALQAIDMVTVDFRDIEKVLAEARFGAQMGFSGKQVIHPSQVQPVQQAFTPDSESITAARKLIEAFEAHQKKGGGAFSLEGKMVDMPLIRSAERVLERARAAGTGWQ